jgi:hypothetical protein
MTRCAQCSALLVTRDEPDDGAPALCSRCTRRALIAAGGAILTILALSLAAVVAGT